MRQPSVPQPAHANVLKVQGRRLLLARLPEAALEIWPQEGLCAQGSSTRCCGCPYSSGGPTKLDRAWCAGLLVPTASMKPGPTLPQQMACAQDDVGALVLVNQNHCSHVGVNLCYRLRWRCHVLKPCCDHRRASSAHQRRQGLRVAVVELHILPDFLECMQLQAGVGDKTRRTGAAVGEHWGAHCTTSLTPPRACELRQ